LSCTIKAELKAEVAHISLNPRGGAERLSVSVIRALTEIGIDVELRTFEKPDHAMMKEAYGETPVKKIQKAATLNLLSNLARATAKSNPDIHINTHGDMLPLFRHDFSKQNSIVYCHYPIAGCLIESGDKDYLDLLFNISSCQIAPEKQNQFLEIAKDAYRNMIISSTVLTNSEFSRRAIFKMYGVNSSVVYPPVETVLFQKAAFASKSPRQDDILVISRFHRSKKIENAIHLAKLLKGKTACRRMVIVGNVSPDGLEYYNFLRKLTKDYGLDGFVRFEPSASFSRLIELMRASKVYLHPLPGEPFGISTVESMSAGLIPVVPDIGGHTEFVPPRYQFHTFEQGVGAVIAALDAPSTESVWMSHHAASFSVPSFVTRFKEILAKVLGTESPQVTSQPLITNKMATTDSQA
jgi:glycosyltransferase involved in cell wall biosynthesis